jgi:hypothetical protein
MSSDEPGMGKEFLKALAIQTVLGLEEQGVIKFKAKVMGGGLATKYNQRSRAMYVIYKTLLIGVNATTDVMSEVVRNNNSETAKYYKGIAECEALDPRSIDIIESINRK